MSVCSFLCFIFPFSLWFYFFMQNDHPVLLLLPCFLMNNADSLPKRPKWWHPRANLKVTPRYLLWGCRYPLAKSWSWDLVTSPLSLSLGAWWSSDDSQWLKPSNVSNELEKLHHLNFQRCWGFNLLVFSSWKTTNNCNPHLNLGLAFPQKGSLSLSTTVA